MFTCSIDVVQSLGRGLGLVGEPLIGLRQLDKFNRLPLHPCRPRVWVVLFCLQKFVTVIGVVKKI
jgi:hypothetical protein